MFNYKIHFRPHIARNSLNGSVCKVECDNRMPNGNVSNWQAPHARVDFVAGPSKSSKEIGQRRNRAESAQPRNTNGHNAASQMNGAEIVSGRWLVKALVGCLIAAGFALYATICLLFYQGQWQFTFFPSGRVQNVDLFAGSWARRTGPPLPHALPPSAATVAASSGLPIEDVRFNYTETGVARLDGWWIPANAQDAGPVIGSNPIPTVPSKMVVLFCSNGRTLMPENVSALRTFHAFGVSVFSFDYRGFGRSQSGHPSMQKSYADGIAALQYLISMRHIEPKRIVIYGAELGAAVAAQVAWQAPQIAGLILENPQPSLAKQVRREQHIHLLPMWLVFTQRFDISQIVPALKIPKLILATHNKPEYTSGATAIYEMSTAPKQKTEISSAAGTSLYDSPAWQQSVAGFLDFVAEKTPASPQGAL